MNKRGFSIVLAATLVGALFSALPARAQAAPVKVPDVVQIDDPKGDANFLNDQDNAYGTPLAGQGDHVGPADIGSATDIMKVWFSNTATEISLNIQLEGNPANLAYDTYFRFSSNAGEGKVAADTTRGCLEWKASVNGAAGAYTGATEGVLTDKCNTGESVVGPLVIAEAEGGGFVVTITFPRSASPLFADGGKLTAPFGVSRVVYVGPLPPPAPAAATGATVDNTKRGTDYVIAGGGPVVTPEQPKEEPPGATEPPGKGKKKGCPKGKGKKKGACPAPKPPVAQCAPYVPGEEGAEAETTVVTAAATEEKPIEVTIAAPPGVPEVALGHVFHNIQVDADGAEGGLFARYEFPIYEDHDIYLNYADGSEAGHVGGFNPAPVPVALGCCDGTGAGGHSEQGAEQIDGMRTADCGGYTLDMASFMSEGGDMTLKLWLGEIQNDPAAPGGELETFFGLLGIAR